MKPTDLKPFFARGQPVAIYQDRFFALPERLIAVPPLSSWEEVFENTHPVSIEYCSGNGHWIVAQAAAHPERNWVAVEWQFERARKIWAKRENVALKNLLIVCGEGYAFTKNHVRDKSVDQLFIHFPDPWPKRRHAKHRLIQQPFLEELHRVIIPGGMFRLVTDDCNYAEETLSLFQHFATTWESLFPPPYFLETSTYEESTFAALWRRQGRSFRHIEYYAKGSHDGK